MLRKRWMALGLFLAAGPLCGSVWAVVETIDATARAAVTQTLANNVVNTDESFETLNASTPNLPLQALARLDQVVSAEAAASVGQAVSQFSDPRLSTTPDPQEFGVEAVAFSFDPVAAYGTENVLTETRTITFTADELGHPDGTPLEVTSYFFLDGFMLQWGDLAGLANPVTARMVIRITQTRPGGISATTVLETSLTFSHDISGVATVTTTGVLSPDNVVVTNSLNPLDLLGTTNVLTIPQLGIPYVYQANVGETFTLQATVDCRMANQPYTGSAIGLGIPVSEYVSTLLELLGEPSTAKLDIPGLTSGVKAVPAKPLPMAQTQVKAAGGNGLALDIGSPFCGLLGVESMMLPALGGFLLIGATRRVRGH